MSTTKAAVIGCGRMGRRHLEVLKRLDLDIVGAVDVFEPNLQTARDEQKLPEGALFKDAGEMLEKARPELVVVATTAETHADMTCLAAERGAKFVLTEKPMATSIADCDRMIAACKQHGTKLAVNHQMRYMEQYTRPRELLRSDEFGGLKSVTVVGGNFGLAMNGTHYFEMFRYLTGSVPEAVTAWFSRETVANPRGPQFVDRAGSIRVEAADGTRMYMDIGADQGHGVLCVYAARNGRITVDELGGWMHLSRRKPEHRKEPTTRYGMPWDEETVKILPADVIEPTRRVVADLIAGGDFPNGEHGRLAVATAVAAYASYEAGYARKTLDGALPRETRYPWA